MRGGNETRPNLYVKHGCFYLGLVLFLYVLIIHLRKKLAWGFVKLMAAGGTHLGGYIGLVITRRPSKFE
jgi:hypothetical protein